jgi:signal transduction histidine kinase
VRARLLLWNVGIVALVLAAMGSLISYTVRAKLMASVERDLREHAGRMRPPPPPVEDGPDGDPNPPGQPRPGPQPPFPREPDGSFSPRIPRAFNPDGIGRPPFQDKTVWDEDAFAQSLKGVEVFKTILVDGEPARLLSRPQWPRHDPAPRPGQPPRPDDPLPPRPDDHPMGVIQAIYPLAEINLSVAEMNATLLTLIPVGLILAAAGGAWLTDRALRPVRQISQTAASIGAADLRQRLPLTGGDEFAELAGTINGMLERLQGAFGRMEVLVEEQRRFTADASHELKTPLTVIKANSSLTLATQPDREGYHEAIVEIDRAANSMNHLVQDLLLLARADEAQAGRNRETLSAGEILRSIAERVRRPGYAEIRCQPIDESATLNVNRDELARVLTNLVENALRHTPMEGTITLSCRTDSGGVTLSVVDTGVGVAAEHLPHLCERFYRVDASRARVDGGSGLGLAICKSLTEANGGRMQIFSQPGQGVTVTLTFLALSVIG